MLCFIFSFIGFKKIIWRFFSFFIWKIFFTHCPFTDYIIIHLSIFFFYTIHTSFIYPVACFRFCYISSLYFLQYTDTLSISNRKQSVSQNSCISLSFCTSCNISVHKRIIINVIIESGKSQNLDIVSDQPTYRTSGNAVLSITIFIKMMLLGTIINKDRSLRSHFIINLTGN